MMKVTTLKEAPHLFEQSVKLIETSFGYPKQHSYKKDFPQVIDQNNHQNLFILEKNNECFGTIFSYQSRWIVGHNQHPLTFIGGISLKEELRGQGIFLNFFEKVLNVLTPRTTLFFLWSDLSGLYEKKNFYEVGTIYEIPSEKITSVNAQKTLLKNLSKEDQSNIKNLYNNNSDIILTQRSENDWKTLFSHQSIELWVERCDKNKIKKYWLEGKGADLNKIIHESSDMENLTLPKLFKGNLWSPIPPKSRNLDQLIRYLGFCKIGNPALFSTFLSDWSDGEVQLSEQDNIESIFFNEELFDIQQKDLIQSIIGPTSIEEFSQFGKNFFINGFDSI